MTPFGLVAWIATERPTAAASVGRRILTRLKGWAMSHCAAGSDACLTRANCRLLPALSGRLQCRTANCGYSPDTSRRDAVASCCGVNFLYSRVQVYAAAEASEYRRRPAAHRAPRNENRAAAG
jgi:hypothetical protein